MPQTFDYMGALREGYTPKEIKRFVKGLDQQNDLEQRGSKFVQKQARQRETVNSLMESSRNRASAGLTPAETLYPAGVTRDPIGQDIQNTAAAPNVPRPTGIVRAENVAPDLVSAFEQAPESSRGEATSGYLAEAPNVKLRGARGVVQGIKDVPKAAWRGLNQAASAGMQAIGDVVQEDVGILTKAAKATGDLLTLNLSPTEIPADTGSNVIQQVGRDAYAAHTQGMQELADKYAPDSWGGAVMNAGAQAGQQLGILGTAAAIGIRNPAAMTNFSLGALGAQSGLTEYGDARSKGFDVPHSMLKGAVGGGMEVVTEVAPMGKLVNFMSTPAKKGVAAFLKDAAEYGLQDIGGELLNTMITDVVNNKMQARPNMTPQEQADEVSRYFSSGEWKQAAADTFKQAVLQSGIMMGAAKGVQHLDAKIRGEQDPLTDGVAFQPQNLPPVNPERRGRVDKLAGIMANESERTAQMRLNIANQRRGEQSVTAPPAQQVEQVAPEAVQPVVPVAESAQPQEIPAQIAPTAEAPVAPVATPSPEAASAPAQDAEAIAPELADLLRRKTNLEKAIFTADGTEKKTATKRMKDNYAALTATITALQQQNPEQEVSANGQQAEPETAAEPGAVATDAAGGTGGAAPADETGMGSAEAMPGGAVSGVDEQPGNGMSLLRPQPDVAEAPQATATPAPDIMALVDGKTDDQIQKTIDMVRGLNPERAGQIEAYWKSKATPVAESQAAQEPAPAAQDGRESVPPAGDATQKGEGVDSQSRETAEVTPQDNNTAKYEYSFSPLDTDKSTAGKIMYHGTKAPINSLSEADPIQHSNESGLYGPGLYLTDNRNIAEGYSKTRGKGPQGKVLSGKLGDVRLLDLEKPASEEVKQAFGSVLESLGDSIKGDTPSEMYDHLAETLTDNDYTKTDAADVLYGLQTLLEDMGFDGLKHTGGTRTKAGKKEGPHNVAILFDTGHPDKGVKTRITDIDDVEGQSVTPSSSVPSAASSPQPQQGKIGGKLAQGEVVLTATGRKTSPFPKVDTSTNGKAGNTIKRGDQWLMDNAIEEARSRDDSFNLRQFEANRDKPSPADKDSAEMYLFGEEQPQVPKPILKPLVTPSEDQPEATADHIVDANEKVGTKAAAPPPPLSPVAAYDDFISRLDAGSATPDDLKASFASLQENRDAIRAELGKLKKDDLLKRLGRMEAYRYKNDKKEVVVNAVFRRMLSSHNLSGTIQYNPMEKGAMDAALKAKVDATTEQDIAAHAEQVKAARKDAKERMDGLVKSLKNPETWEEFQNFIAMNKDKGGIDALTSEQRKRYDELHAERNKEAAAKQIDRKAQVNEAGAQVDSEIIETTHTKTKEPLFVVKAADRVDKDIYREWNATAKKLGGWYSSYRGSGAVPGFQFKTRESAESFKQYLKGDAGAARETIKERIEGRQESKKQSAADRMAALADSMEEKANATLNADRLTNTARRAAQAESTDAAARKTIALATTIRNIANAIQSGEAKHLEGISAGTHVETLNSVLSRAKYANLRENGGPSWSVTDERYRMPNESDMDYVEYPYPSQHRDHIKEIGLVLRERSGAVKDGEWLMKRYAAISGDDTSVITFSSPTDIERLDGIVAKAKKVPRLKSAVENVTDGMADYKRLQKMGIPDEPTLRAALREYLQFKDEGPKADKAKQLERQLAGNKSVGIDFFPTPPAVAADLVERAGIEPGMKVLEPSGGTGNIAEAMRETGADVDVAEISGQMRDLLEAKGFNLVAHDFMDLDEGGYDAIVMNPPFSADIEHVRHAFDLLKPGGRLVSIVGEGSFGSQKKHTEFQDWLDEHGAEVEKLPQGTFTDRTQLKTTGANARVVEMVRPKDPVIPSMPEQTLVENKPQEGDGRPTFSRLIPAGKRGNAQAYTVNLSPSQSLSMKEIRQEVSDGEAGGRAGIYNESAPGTTQVSWGSSFPEYFQNKGLTKKQVLPVLDRIIAGQPVTETQWLIAEDMLKAKRYDTLNRILNERQERRIESLSELTDDQITEANDFADEFFSQFDGTADDTAASTGGLREDDSAAAGRDGETSGREEGISAPATVAIDESGWGQQVAPELQGNKKAVSFGDKEQAGRTVGLSEFMDGFTPDPQQGLFGGTTTLDSMGLQQIYERLANTKLVKDAMADLKRLGKHIYAMGSTAWKPWFQGMKEALGKQFRRFRPVMEKLYAATKSDVRYSVNNKGGKDADNNGFAGDKGIRSNERQDNASGRSDGGTMSQYADSEPKDSTERVERLAEIISDDLGGKPVVLSVARQGGKANDGRRVSGAFGRKDRTGDPRVDAVLDKIGSPDKTLADRIKDSLGNLAHKETRMREIEQGFFDRYASLRYLDKMAGVTGPDDSAYISARMTTSFSDVMYAMVHHGHPVWKDGGSAVQGKGLMEIFKPVADELDVFMGWMVGARAQKLMNEGRERYFDQDEINILKGLKTPENSARWEKVRRDYMQYKKQVLDFAEQAGVINPEARRIWDHEEYVPFYRVVEDKPKGPFKVKGLASQNSGIRTLKGADERLGDIFENIIQNFSHLTDAAIKNRATELAVQKAEQIGAATPAPLEWKAVKIGNQQVVDAVHEFFGETQDDIDAFVNPEEMEAFTTFFHPAKPMGKDVIHVLRDGKPQYYQVHDDLLLRSMTSINEQIWGGPAMTAMRFVKRLLTIGVTSDPTFMLRNFIRDTLHTWTISRGDFTPVVSSLTGAVKAFREDDDMVQLMAAGGAFHGGFAYGNDPAAVKLMVRKLITKKGIDRNTILDTVKKVWEAYQEIGSALENAARVQTYANAKAKTGSHLQAAFDAKDVMDFSVRGDWAAINFLVQTVPFLGARIQGLQRLGKGMRENPVAFTLKGTAIALASTLLWLHNRLRPEYQELEEWDKDTYFHFFVGKKHFRLPKPFEVGAIFGTIPERLMELTLEKQHDGWLFAERLMAVITQTFAVGLPQILSEPAQQWANKDFFTGREIVGRDLQRLLPGEQSNPYTSATAKELGRAIHVSPRRLEHAVKGYFGTLGMYCLGASDMLVRKLWDYPAKPTTKPEDWPVLSAFYRGEGPARNTKYATEFYELLREADQLTDTIQRLRETGEVSRADKLIEKNLPKLAAGGILGQAQSELSRINKQMKRVHLDRSMSPDEKKEQLVELQRIKNDITRGVVGQAKVERNQ